MTDKQPQGGRGSSVVQSILIIRLSAIGDIVMASGILPALRRRYPGARIDWLVQPECRELLQEARDLDRVIVWPRRQWGREVRSGQLLRLWGNLRDLVHELRQSRYDLVLDMQGLWKSAIWARLSGGRERIGLGSKEGSAVAMTRVLRLDRNDTRLGSEYKTMLRAVGAEVADSDYRLGIGASAEEGRQARELLASRLDSRPYAVFCPFTTRPQKHWLAERWVELARSVSRDLDLQPVLLGGPGDRAQAEALTAKASGALADLTGQTSLRQSLAIISQASLLVGVDTGLTHMGVMAGVPSVALFGATRPYLETGGERSRVLYVRHSCSPCRRSPVCEGSHPCMRALEVEAVLQAADAVVEP